MKNETEQKRGHLVRKMTLEKKETANDAHGGVRHKKGMNQARSGSKSPVCRLYAHGVRRVVHRGAPQVPPHCAVCLLLSSRDCSVRFVITKNDWCTAYTLALNSTVSKRQHAELSFDSTSHSNNKMSCYVGACLLARWVGSKCLIKKQSIAYSHRIRYPAVYWQLNGSSLQCPYLSLCLWSR